MFARREAKTRIRERDWLKLASEKIRREQVGTVSAFLSVRANKFAKWKIGFTGNSLEYIRINISIQIHHLIFSRAYSTYDRIIIEQLNSQEN